MKEITQASDVSHTPFPLFSLPINFLNLRPQCVWHVLDALRPTSERICFPFVWWRKSTVARYKGIGDHRDQPFSGRINDPAADNSAGIAAKAHAHG